MAVKSTAAMIRGRQSYNANLLWQNAEMILADAKHIADVFPASSPNNPDSPDSVAKLLIWEQWNQSMLHAQDLDQRAEKLIGLSKDPAKAPAAFNAMMMVCTSGHQTDRISR